MPKGWHLKINHGGITDRRGWSIGADGIETINGSSDTKQQAQRDAVAALMEAVRMNLDQGWTLHTGNRVHLVIIGQARALCGSRLQDGPDINRYCTPPCGRCTAIERTIERITGKEIGECGSAS